MKGRFYLSFLVICDECKMALIHEPANGMPTILRHPIFERCSQSGKTFEPPYVELKEIVTNEKQA